MGQIQISVGSLTSTRTFQDAKMQTLILAVLEQFPDLLNEADTNQKKLDAMMDVMVDGVVRVGRKGLRSLRVREAVAQAEAEAEDLEL